MKFACPYCRRECDYEEIIMDADLLAIIGMQPVFGKNASLVWAYCELFGILPLKTRRKKLRLLLEEMKRLFDSEAFSYKKTTYAISQAGIAEALNLVVHRHWTDHLENHNYIKKVMIGIGERETQTAGKDAEVNLRKKEARLAAPREVVPVEGRAPSRPQQEGDPAPDDALPGQLTPAQYEANKRRVQALLKTIATPPGGRHAR